MKTGKSLRGEPLLMWEDPEPPKPEPPKLPLVIQTVSIVGEAPPVDVFASRRQAEKDHESPRSGHAFVIEEKDKCGLPHRRTVCSCGHLGDWKRIT
jgi:hypothetical protein